MKINLSSIASKPIKIRWIRTGSQSYWKIMYIPSYYIHKNVSTYFLVHAFGISVLKKTGFNLKIVHFIRGKLLIIAPPCVRLDHLILTFSTRSEVPARLRWTRRRIVSPMLLTLPEPLLRRVLFPVVVLLFSGKIHLSVSSFPVWRKNVFFLQFCYWLFVVK